MAKTVQQQKTKSSQPAASICWFDVPADDLGRAKKFYGSLFGWKVAKFSQLSPTTGISTLAGRMPRRTVGSCPACIPGTPSWST